MEILSTIIREEIQKTFLSEAKRPVSKEIADAFNVRIMILLLQKINIRKTLKDVNYLMDKVKYMTLMIGNVIMLNWIKILQLQLLIR